MAENKLSSWMLERIGQRGTISLPEGHSIVGRLPKCDIRICSRFCSRRHCKFSVNSEGVTVSDFSTNGVFVNSEKYVNQEVELKSDDRVGIGCEVTDEECAGDDEYYVFRLRKTTPTKEALNNVCLKRKKSQDTSKVDNESEKTEVECESDEVDDNKKENKVPDSKYEKGKNDKNGADIEKNTKNRTSVIKEHLDLIEILEGGNSKETDAFNVNCKSAHENDRDEVQSDQIVVLISDEDEDDNSDIVQQRNLKSFSSSNKINNNLVRDEEESTKTTISEQVKVMTTESRKDSKHFPKSDSLHKDSDCNSKKNVFKAPTVDSVKKQRSSKDNTDKRDTSTKSGTIMVSENNSKLEHLKTKNNVQGNWKDPIIVPDNDDEEESEILLSQSLIRVIKQEVVDLEMSFFSDDQHVDRSNTDDNDIEGKPDSSPIIEQDDINDENVFQHGPHLESDWDNMYQENTSKEIETKAKPRVAEKRKLPEIIEAPSLPEKRGKLRGVSAEATKHKTSLEIAPKKKETFKKKEKPVSREQWLQKPSLQKRSHNAKVKKYQEERKLKLKEIAQEQADKRKSNDDNCVKIVNKPKVKVTMKNRGSFLTGEEQGESNANGDCNQMRASKLSSKTFSSNNVLVKTEPVEDSCEVSEGLNDGMMIDTAAEPQNQNIQSVTKIGEVVETDLQHPSKMHSSLTHQKSKFKLISKNVTTLKSIIKRRNSSKPRKKVRFCDDPKITYIPREESSGRKVDSKDIPIHFLTKASGENVLSDILAWNPKWLETRKDEVNGRNHVLVPMLHQFSSFDDFKRILVPLMKLEVWAEIQQNTNSQKGSSTGIKLEIENHKLERRGDGKRYVYYCDYVPINLKNGFPFNISDLCIITVESSRKSLKMFAYIESYKKIGCSQNSHYQVVLTSTAIHEYKELLDTIKSVYVKPITQLRVDLGAFTAVHHLKYSALLEPILDPTKLLHSKMPSIDSVRYKGYEDMNKNQMDILLKTYLKCANLDESNICLIEGPPGTGKSRLISNLVLQLLYGVESRNTEKKILICSQSNAAIDVITTKLLKIRAKMLYLKFKLVRFGILEKMSPSVRAVSVQNLVDRQLVSPENQNILKRERELLEKRIKEKSEKIESGANSVQYEELMKLTQQLDVVKRLPNQQNLLQKRNTMYRKQVQGAHIVCTTLSSCIHMLQYTNNFDICIIDEATLCVEPWTLIPLQFDISSLVLVGDTQQLPATVLSKISADYGLGQSLFTRIKKCLNSNDSIFQLRTQYRMHPEICKWPNSYFYNNMLSNDKSTEVKLPVKPYSILNLDFSKNEDFINGKITNQSEADFVVQLLIQLTKLLPTNKFSYGVITPYAHQTDIVYNKLRIAGIRDIGVNTIDSYQGKEKDVIIFSNTRTKGVGFLGNCQRLNVALTRARRCLILCGRFSCVESIHVWKSLLDDAKKRQLFYNIAEQHLQDFEKNVMTKLLC